jgi:hypothetical protein
MLTGNMLVAAQVANDHMRLGGSHNTAGGIEATRNPKVVLDLQACLFLLGC